jgi:RNA polymerase sigma-70 factor, ECF subfamily
MPRVLVLSAPHPTPVRELGRAAEDLSRVAEDLSRAAGAAARTGNALLAHTTTGLRAVGARAFSAILPRARRSRVKARPSVSQPSTSTSRPAPDGRSDEELFVAHRNGDERALRVLVDRYRAELHGFLTRLVGSRAGADDVFQEAFLQVHLSAETFDQERRFKPWLYTIAANKGRDFLRRQKRRAAASLDAAVAPNGDGALIDLIEGDSTAPSLPLETSDEAAMVKLVVDGLPPHFREILLLSYFQKFSYAQISDSLSIPLGTVKSRLHAAVACFAESWKLACARRGVPLPGEQRAGEGWGAGQDTRSRNSGTTEPRAQRNPANPDKPDNHGDHA